MSTTGVPLIRYIEDYEIGAVVDRKRFQINQAGGGRTELHVTFATGRSTEFLIRETFEKLDDVREAYLMAGTPWDGPRRFYELKHVLISVARNHYSTIVARDYPDQADKTDDNYEELRRQIITAMSDHILPGNKVRTYLTQNIKYLKCKMSDGSGRVEKPVDVLARMNQIKQMASTMLHHDRGAVFLSDQDTTSAYWRIFPNKMHDWLTNEQNINPFDANNPLDAMEIADQFQRYWNMHFKNEKKKEGENDSGGKRKDRDGDDRDGGNRRRKTGRKHGGNSKHGNSNDGNEDGGKCAITGHQKFRHNWQGCFLNPYCRHFDANEAEKFFNENAHGPNAFYKDVYKNRPQANGGRNYNGPGRGFQGRGGGRGGGRGFSGGRGFQGGRGRGRGGYQNQGYRQQGDQQGNNYQGNNQQQGYHYDNNFNGQGGGDYFGPPRGQGQDFGGNQHAPDGGVQDMEGYHFDQPRRATSGFNRARPTGYLGARRGKSTRFGGW